LLRDVADFKQKFYPSKWARYDLAKPGTFRLIPDQSLVTLLARDYRDMAVMLFGEAPPFTTIMTTLTALEDEINHGAAKR
jgi:hypothetical protein